ncbi:LysE family translocator [Priestia filamentosa]|uniref:LysE family translocator n=1 Tax=Priestia filamentosa TaxID=1402861 RepID=UPI002E20CDEC|nr:LysE family transporter [Priestia filamentosa]MED3729404.1 LysE family transporter [Priestia filamentosa]
MFFEIFLIGILSGLSPGPDFFLVMKNSLGFGRRIGIATALGVASALFFHVTYTILGFTYIIEKFPSIFIVIKLAGSLYLLWLGYHAIRAVKQSKEEKEMGLKVNTHKSIKQGFREGFICNVLNPKAALFFLSIFSQFISSDTASWVRWVYGTEIILAVALWFTFVSSVISYKKFRDFYEKYNHWFDRCLGAILIYFAIFIVYSTIHS